MGESELKPLAIDLFCGLGGWSEGLLAEGYRVVGFDIERHEYGDHKYPAQLVIQDVLTLHGSQFKDAALIVASPPCQEFSYMAMPWTLAKEKRARILADAEERKRLTALFDACFRIQREASEAAGRYIPLVAENVRGAQEWVGRAAWHYGSFYLWGDIPALMPIARAFKNPGFRFDDSGKSFQSESVNRMSDGIKVPMPAGGDSFTVGFQQVAKLSASEGRKLGPSPGKRWEDRPANVAAHREGTKARKDGFGYGGGFGWDCSPMRRHSSKSTARKAASARIAKIPFVLAQHIARAWKPQG